ncbi:hypothetical protein MPSEU_000478700 [Mayamaea pseudoterrestris]|nr:hypothetical protein MPSEU_000478700 [Mayamaea pseudoterrestris]
MDLRRLLALVASCIVLPITYSKDSTGECLPSPKDENHFYCYSPSSHDKTLFCEDTVDKCSEWSDKNECSRNPRFMLVHCPKSCDSCMSPHIECVQIKHSDDNDHGKFFAQFVKTHEYMQERIAINPRYLKSCRNYDPFCTVWASKGECEANAKFMKEKCPAACQKCSPL